MRKTTRRDLVPTFLDEAPTLHCIDEAHFQAQCRVCLRSSPIVGGEIEDALIRVADLGWTTTQGYAWTCPLCQDRQLGRYAAR